MSKYWDDREVTITVKFWISWPKDKTPAISTLRDLLSSVEAATHRILLENTAGGIVHHSMQDVTLKEDLDA